MSEDDRSTVVDSKVAYEASPAKELPPPASTAPSAGHTPDGGDVPTAKPPIRSRRDPSLVLGAMVLALLIVLVSWQVSSDRLVPYTARGAVSGYVTQLSPRVAGQVTGVLVQDGEVVQAGTVLAQLDTAPFDLAVSQAEANLSKALQSTRASATGIVGAQAGVTEARAHREDARSNLTRTLELVSRGFLSETKADDARAGLRNADASLQQAQANLDRVVVVTGGAGSASNPEVRSAQLQLERAQLDRRYATLKAPTLGVVTNLRLAIGQYVAPGAPTMTFIDARGAWITADVRENQLGLVQPGDEVAITFDAVPGEVYRGHVQSIAWGIDVGRGSPGGLLQNLPEGRWFEPSRRIPVRVELEGGLDRWPRAARVGGKAGVLIYAEGRDSPLAWIATALMHGRSWLSYLY